jgi:hypothetical protein
MRSLFVILLLPIFALAQDYDLKSKAEAHLNGSEKSNSNRPLDNCKNLVTVNFPKKCLKQKSGAKDSECVPPKGRDVRAEIAKTVNGQKGPITGYVYCTDGETGTTAANESEAAVPNDDGFERGEARMATKHRKDQIKWAGQVSYGIRTDLADQVKPRLYQHDFSLSYGFEHQPTRISVSAIASAGYESAGEQRSEVLLDENDTELFMNDITLALQKTWALEWKSTLSLTLGNEFPTSPESKREGYGSVTSLGVDWNVPLVPKKISVSLGGEVYYIWNSYEYSPATGDLNKQGGARATAGVRWTIWKGWYVRASAGSQQSRYLDGTSDVTYRNSIGTGYNFGRLSLSLSTSNGTYLDREEAYIWFVDEYRRTLALGASYSF